MSNTGESSNKRGREENEAEKSGKRLKQLSLPLVNGRGKVPELISAEMAEGLLKLHETFLESNTRGVPVHEHGGCRILYVLNPEDPTPPFKDSQA